MALPNYEKAIKFADMDSKYKSIGSIYLTGAGYIDEEFKGIGVDSQFGWEELTWFKNPTRDRTFAFQNMDDIDVGLIARCEVNIKYMDVEQYIKLRNIVGRERYFQATFFNSDTGKWITRMMYCTENTKRQLFTLKQSLIGVLDLSLKFVGTNTDVNDDTKFTVTFNLNGGSNNSDHDFSKVHELEYGEQLKIAIVAPADKLSAPIGYHFKYWATLDENGKPKACYGEKQRTTVWNDMNLYAIWEDTDGNIL